jgi:predicted nucleic acid-binding protein
VAQGTTDRLTLDRDAQADAPDELSALGIAGGAVYDGLIALTARAAGAELVSLDRRAAETYERCGASVRLLR